MLAGALGVEWAKKAIIIFAPVVFVLAGDCLFYSTGRIGLDVFQVVTGKNDITKGRSVMKSALKKDTVREISHSLGRFLSIFLIVLLGCGFFSGIKATMPDMIDTAEKYFSDNRLMVIKLMSSIGVKSEDVEAVKKARTLRALWRDILRTFSIIMKIKTLC